MESKKTIKHAVASVQTPIAIVIAGLLIAGAVYLGPKGSAQPAVANAVPGQKAAEAPKGNLDAMAPITSEDHIRGDINAPVKIVEYSDTECPFCKRFHITMKQMVEQYGKSGKVAWVYRHFPLEQLHSKARKEAEATECAGELGGNDKFWAYLDRMMEITPGNDGLDPVELPKIAQHVGLNVNKFNECLSSGKYSQKISDHIKNAVATGGRGTPWNIVVGKNDKKYSLSGAQPLAAIQQLIELAAEGK